MKRFPVTVAAKVGKSDNTETWRGLELATLALVLVFTGSAYFFIYKSLLLFRLTNIAITVTHIHSLRIAARESGAYKGLLISLSLFLYSIVFKFPVALE
jgi:hypothetical protein